MKKVFVVLALVGFTFSTISCRETTQDKIENSAEAAGEDIENGLEEAGDAIENAAEKTGDAIDKAGEELEEEIEGTDDYNGDDDNN
ncbi:MULTISPECIES: Rv0909 family putative TA system antitoxin [unclassified Dokdonia]|jgi:predicted small secreted protein|uniref:Rv0909 family putative TA system antitoxin n=1 Tax=unclassified Dokdonia TaxID=2615033 RepID=UPI000D5443FF|nr:Rv0909 family putative TA system antitoxin [Dokdonia sp. Dokd-P16]AWH73284.1 hypothetical protein DCS32_03630 [Dokdonia sp. Dokd-P16]